MFSRFSVLSKFYKYPKLTSNYIRHLCKFEQSRNFLTKNHTNVLSPQNVNCVPITARNRTCFKIACNLSSSNNEGDGKNLELNGKENKSLQVGKKPTLSKSKMKNLKKPHLNCKRCKANKQYSSNERSNTENSKIKAKLVPYKRDTESVEAQVLEPTNRSILESQLPNKTVHVEFMESQNLKDFNLNKSAALPFESIYNAQQSSIDIKTKPIISQKDQNSSNAKNTVEKQALTNLKTQELKNANLNTQMSKSEEKALIRERSLEPKSLTVLPSETSILKVKKSDSQTISPQFRNDPKRSSQQKINAYKSEAPKTAIGKSDKSHEDKNTVVAKEQVKYISKSYDLKARGAQKAVTTNKPAISAEKNILVKPSYSNVSNKPESIKIYQAHPRRKTKIKVPNQKQSQLKIAGKGKEQRTGVLKSKQITKSKRVSGGRGGSFNDGDNKSNFKAEGTSSTKDRPKKFWRTFSLSILSFITGLAIYALSNVGAVDMLKDIRYMDSSEMTLPMKLWPTFYGKRSKSEQLDINETESEENENDDKTGSL